MSTAESVTSIPSAPRRNRIWPKYWIASNSKFFVARKGESDATSEIVWEDEKTSYYHDSCGQRMTNRTLHTKSRQEQSGTGQGIDRGKLFVEFAGNGYRFNIVIPALESKDARADVRQPSGYCSPEHNQPENSTRELDRDRVQPVEIDDAVLDPKVIEGSPSFIDLSREEIESRWSFRNWW